MTGPVEDPEPAVARTPVALALSCLFGALGLVLLVGGLATSTNAVLMAGTMAGTLSLAAALYWRSDLVSSWAARKRGGGP